jgi:hypothetical protein
VLGLGKYIKRLAKIPYIVRGVRRQQWWSCLLGWYAQEMVLAQD